MVNLPTAPTISTPSPPKLLEIKIPAPIDLNINPFTAIAPSPDFGSAPPSDIAFVYNAYGNTIQDLLDGKIADFLEYIDPRTSNSIRVIEARKILFKEAKQAGKGYIEEEATRNFVSPPGNTSESLDAMDVATRERATTIEAEETKRSMELALALMKFAMSAVNTREEVVFDSHRHIQAATLEVAIAVSRNVQAGYAAKIDAYNAELSTWDAKLTAWQAGAQAQLTNLEAYKMRLEGVRAEQLAMAPLWELYNLGVAVHELNAKVQILIYQSFILESDLKVAQLKKNIAEFELYTARINANTALYKVYRAQLATEMAKIEEYESLVRVAKAQLRSEEAELASERVTAEGEIDIANAHLIELRNQLQIERERLEVLVLEGEVTAQDYDVQLAHFAGQVREWFDDATKLIDDFVSLEQRKSVEETVLSGIKWDEKSTTTGVDSDIYTSKQIVDDTHGLKKKEAEIEAESKLETDHTHKIIKVL